MFKLKCKESQVLVLEKGRGVQYELGCCCVVSTLGSTLASRGTQWYCASGGNWYCHILLIRTAEAFQFQVRWLHIANYLIMALDSDVFPASHHYQNNIPAAGDYNIAIVGPL